MAALCARRMLFDAVASIALSLVVQSRHAVDRDLGARCAFGLDDQRQPARRRLPNLGMRCRDSSKAATSGATIETLALAQTRKLPIGGAGKSSLVGQGCKRCSSTRLLEWAQPPVAERENTRNGMSPKPAHSNGGHTRRRGAPWEAPVTATLDEAPCVPAPANGEATRSRRSRQAVPHPQWPPWGKPPRSQ
jgi:hypothetical protein